MEHLSTVGARLEQGHKVTLPRACGVLEAVIEEVDVQVRGVVELRARPMSSYSTITSDFRLCCGPQT
jgi:hypothetical protein